MQAYAAMIGDNPAANARDARRDLGRGPLQQPGDDFQTARWLESVLRWVRRVLGYGLTGLFAALSMKH